MEKEQFFISVKGTRVEVSEEVYLIYYRSKRRERYFEQDIKSEKPIRDEDGNIIGFHPSKEDSYERLISVGEEFASEQDSIEDMVFGRIMSDKLHEALDRLPDDERALINTLFFDGMTERQAAAMLGLSQKGVNKRKAKILKKLKKILGS